MYLNLPLALRSSVGIIERIIGFMNHLDMSPANIVVQTSHIPVGEKVGIVGPRTTDRWFSHFSSRRLDGG